MREWNRLSLLGTNTRGSLPEFHHCDDYDGSHEEDVDDGGDDGDDVDNDGDDVDNDSDDVDHILATTTTPSCSLAISSLSLTHSSLVLPSFSADHDDNLI